MFNSECRRPLPRQGPPAKTGISLPLHFPKPSRQQQAASRPRQAFRGRVKTHQLIIFFHSLPSLQSYITCSPLTTVAQYTLQKPVLLPPYLSLPSRPRPYGADEVLRNVLVYPPRVVVQLMPLRHPHGSDGGMVPGVVPLLGPVDTLLEHLPHCRPPVVVACLQLQGASEGAR